MKKNCFFISVYIIFCILLWNIYSRQIRMSMIGFCVRLKVTGSFPRNWAPLGFSPLLQSKKFQPPGHFFNFSSPWEPGGCILCLCTQVMLVLILIINVEYLQNNVFGFETGLNGQNHSLSDSHCLIKEFPLVRFPFPALWGFL